MVARARRVWEQFQFGKSWKQMTAVEEGHGHPAFLPHVQVVDSMLLESYA